jgi:hypothetical protein
VGFGLERDNGGEEKCGCVSSHTPQEQERQPGHGRLVYFSGIFTPERYGDMWGFDVHPILSNPLKYFFPKILYHDGEFLIYPKIH